MQHKITGLQQETECMRSGVAACNRELLHTDSSDTKQVVGVLFLFCTEERDSEVVSRGRCDPGTAEGLIVIFSLSAFLLCIDWEGWRRGFWVSNTRV